jgi:hypothetical protein
MMRRVATILNRKKAVLSLALIFSVNIPASGKESRFTAGFFAVHRIFYFEGEYYDGVGGGEFEMTYDIARYFASGIIVEGSFLTGTEFFFAGANLKIKFPAQKFILSMRIKGGYAFIRHICCQDYSPSIGFGTEFQVNFTDSIALGIIIDEDIVFQDTAIAHWVENVDRENVYGISIGLGMRIMF